LTFECVINDTSVVALLLIEIVYSNTICFGDRYTERFIIRYSLNT